MSEADEFASVLLEEAKRFLEKADEADADGAQAYLHASLTLTFCALEAHVNAICAELGTRSEFTVPEKSILLERDYELRDGELQLGNRLKMWRLQDRLLFLARRVAVKPIEKGNDWWGQLLDGIDLRNDLIHPKGALKLNRDQIERAVRATIACLDFLYQGIYRAKFPGGSRQTQSKLTF